MSIDKWIQHHSSEEPFFGLDRSKGINRNVPTEPTMTTIEELEAQLETVTRERDEARAEVERLQQFWQEASDARSTEMACRMIAERACDAACRHRDEARAEVERLTDERDELLVRVADAGAELRATREAYNEARAEVERLSEYEVAAFAWMDRAREAEFVREEAQKILGAYGYVLDGKSWRKKGAT